MMPPGAQPTPAPLHDIVDVMQVFPYPLWMLILAGLGALLLLGLLIWAVFLRKRAPRVFTPKERALQSLQLLQSENCSPYEFGIKISDVLRRYLEEAFGMRAVTTTSLEFLEIIRNNSVFSEQEKESLREFLEKVDLIKFARVEAGGEELHGLFAAAEAVVKNPSREGVK